MSDDKHYEMLWDCPNCDTTKLLGVTHRYCPACGSPQDASKRYFPPDDEKIAVEDHVYAGADVQCRQCDTPNSASAVFCTGCGSPLDGGKEIARKEDAVVGAPPAPKPGATPPPPPPPATGGTSRRSGCLLMLGAVMLFVLASVLVYAFWTTEASLEVTGHSWSRTIEVEVYKTVREDAWKESVPTAAYEVSCRDKKRDTRKVPDGEDCKKVNVDQGDGTFKQKEECKTRYREEDVYDRFCDYKIDKWARDRTAKADGRGFEPAPSWPELSLRTCQSIGCEREGRRDEAYTVHFKAEDAEMACTYGDEPAWKAFAAGSKWIGQVRLDGSLVCGSLEPAK